MCCLLVSSLCTLRSPSADRTVTLLSVSRPDGSDVPVAYVQIGAMLVGGIARTVDEGSEVQRGDELGYFGALRFSLPLSSRLCGLGSRAKRGPSVQPMGASPSSRLA